MIEFLLTRLGRFLAPILALTVSYTRLTPIVMALEKYFAFLVGRGSGSGWDIRGEVKSVSRFINSNCPIVFDVGANDGRWALALSNHLGSCAKVYLFECAEYCFPGLEKRMPHIPNPQLIKKAVSDNQN